MRITNYTAYMLVAITLQGRKLNVLTLFPRKMTKVTICGLELGLYLLFQVIPWKTLV